MVGMITNKRWGHEEVVVNNDAYCGKFLHFNPGASGSLHYHEIKHETFYLLSGCAEVEVRCAPYHEVYATVVLKEGDTLEIPQFMAHRVTARELGAVIVEFSTHHSDDDVVRLVEAPK